MGWIKKVNYKEGHKCNTPKLVTRGFLGLFAPKPRFEFGSIWQCDECGTKWVTVKAFGRTYGNVGLERLVEIPTEMKMPALDSKSPGSGSKPRQSLGGYTAGREWGEKPKPIVPINDPGSL